MLCFYFSKFCFLGENMAQSKLLGRESGERVIFAILRNSDRDNDRILDPEFKSRIRRGLHNVGRAWEGLPPIPLNSRSRPFVSRAR